MMSTSRTRFEACRWEMEDQARIPTMAEAVEFCRTYLGRSYDFETWSDVQWFYTPRKSPPGGVHLAVRGRPHPGLPKKVMQIYFFTEKGVLTFQHLFPKGDGVFDYEPLSDLEQLAYGLTNPA